MSFPTTAGGANLTRVASSGSNGTILAGNQARRGVVIYNSDTNALLLKYGATASATSYTYRIQSGQTFEMSGIVFTGQLDGLWEAAGSGSAFVTELVA